MKNLFFGLFAIVLTAGLASCGSKACTCTDAFYATSAKTCTDASTANEECCTALNASATLLNKGTCSYK
jgi:hypothetical protein